MLIAGMSPVTVRGSTVRASTLVDEHSRDALTIYRAPSDVAVARRVVVDGCRVIGRQDGNGITIGTTSTIPRPTEDPYAVVIANSVVEDARVGVLLNGASVGSHPPVFALLGNTVRRNRIGVQVHGPAQLHSFNNAVTENWELGMTVPGTTVLAHGHNAFGANASNFSGFAPAATYVTDAPQWLPGALPVPAPESPLVGSGTWLAHEWVQHDYWYRPRFGGHVDIGAIQSAEMAQTEVRVLLSQVAYDTPGFDASTEFVELHNAGDTPADLGGWTLTDDGGTWTLPSPTYIGAWDFLVIARQATGYSSWTGGVADVSGLSLNLGNGSDGLVLRDLHGVPVDAVLWETGAWPSASTGTVILRIDPANDTDSSQDWAAGPPVVR